MRCELNRKRNIIKIIVMLKPKTRPFFASRREQIQAHTPVSCEQLLFQCASKVACLYSLGFNNMLWCCLLMLSSSTLFFPSQLRVGVSTILFIITELHTFLLRFVSHTFFLDASWSFVSFSLIGNLACCECVRRTQMNAVYCTFFPLERLEKCHWTHQMTS